MWPDLASTRELKSVLDVLSAMITPAVLYAEMDDITRNYVQPR